MRLDQYLVSHHYFDSRNKASASVKLGNFTVNNKIITKPAHEIGEDDVVAAIKQVKTYVARSAEKLLCAIKTFPLNFTNKIVADFGASTGGFCQVMLENNVNKIYAVDIGTAQLHPLILSDERVINMEHTNARYLTAADFSDPIDVVTADLSFISLSNILPAIYKTLASHGEAVVLVKPQFEAGKKNLNKNGVVSDRKIHVQVLNVIVKFAEDLGFGIGGIAFSGLAGESGNREYLLYLQKDIKSALVIQQAIERAVFGEDKNG